MPDTELPDIIIPTGLLPADGRFGSGPSKVRAEAVASLSLAAQGPLGTSHRQKPVRSLVGRLRAGLAELFGLPEGYEVVLGNGGTTAFWDIATFCLVDRHSQHLSFGEFSSKFAAAAKAAPWLDDPDVVTSPAGTHPTAIGRSGVDLYALTHNETSTGVMMEIRRPDGADPGALVAVDATSAAAGLRVDAREFDAYYFALQKGFASDGGLWIALLSPAAVARVGQLAGPGSTRFVPAFLDLAVALENSRLDQTYNTPAVAPLLLAVDQLEWVLGNGGLEFSASRCDRSAEILYGWAESTAYTAPFVAKPDQRSHVVGTIDFGTSVDAALVARVLRANGIVDTEPYRKLGRNQLRVAMFPAIEPDDVAALTACIDHVVGALS
jgi:phosphoserine aminotransferase